MLRLIVLFVSILLLMASKYSACKQIYTFWLSSNDFYGLWLVPIFACIVIWQNAKALLAFQWKGFFWTLVPLSIIIIFQLFGRPVSSRMQVLLLIVSIELITLTIIGKHAFKYVTAPLLLSVMAIPPPDWLWQEITLITQYLSFEVSTFIYGLLAPISCEGFSVFLHNCRKWEVMGPECSGARSMLGLCILSLFLILRSKLKPAAALLLVLIVPPIAFSFNICRILFLVLLRDHGLEEYTVDFWHGLTGITAFLLGLLAVDGLIKFSRSYNMSRKSFY